jgi:hypothetical protein
MDARCLPALADLAIDLAAARQRAEIQETLLRLR